MSLEWMFWAIGIWFLIGAVCAGLVYQDQVDRKVKGWKWPLLCIPLSVIGYYLYHSERSQVRPTARELPPRQHYPAPEYQFKEPPQEPVEARTETEPLTPMEAAVTAAASSRVQEEPVVEPLAPPPVEKDTRTAEERVEPSRPKAQQIEGIPRCGSCGAAVSSYDVACKNCGAPLRP